MSILRKARELLTDPENWTKGAFHKTRRKSGGTTEHSYCALGAWRKVSGKGLNDPGKARNLLFRALKEKTGRTCVIRYNDDHRTTHKDILELFDLAICMEECENEHTTGCAKLN